MKPGILKLDGKKLACGPTGWTGSDRALCRALGKAFPPRSTSAGVPWVRAFYEAAGALKAAILQRPEPDPLPAGAVA
jgi:hypothetical protein